VRNEAGSREVNATTTETVQVKRKVYFRVEATSGWLLSETSMTFVEQEGQQIKNESCTMLQVREDYGQYSS